MLDRDKQISQATGGKSALFPGPAQGDWPEFGLVDDVLGAVAEVLAAGDNAALATLIFVDGPSPRPLGAQMLIAKSGEAAGYVSGGCVEGSIALLGREVIETGQTRKVIFGAGSPFFDVPLVCGAQIEVMIEPVSPDDKTWAEVLEARAERRPIARHVAADGRAWCTAGLKEILSVDKETGAVVRTYDPPMRLVVLGRDPIAMATARIARAAGIDTVFVRRQGPQDAPAALADRYETSAPGAAFEALGLDAWTAIVTTTHDLDEDHETLLAALPSSAFYVGALGSRRRVAARIKKLESEGVPWEAVKRLRAPVGMDIGAASPNEIAVSIVADIIRVKRSGA